MKAILCGAGGAMGQLLQQLLSGELAGLVSLDGANGAARTFTELGDVDADIVIDFSHHSSIADVLGRAKALGCPAVIGTTGHTPQEVAMIWDAAHEIPVFYSGNMSLGIAVLCRLARQAAACFPQADIEILEVHHNRKVDAPSGTARMLFKAIQEVRPQAREVCGRSGEGKRQSDEIGIASLRMGNVVGVHEVHICAGSQSLILRHEAGDRKMLAEGAVDAARFILGKPAGLYTMEHLLEERA